MKWRLQWYLNVVNSWLKSGYPKCAEPLLTQDEEVAHPLFNYGIFKLNADDVGIQGRGKRAWMLLKDRRSLGLTRREGKTS